MANKKNKVKFNICNVHYAPITVAEEGTVSFGTPVPMPGAVSISMDPTGEPESFYADGIEYYVINNNQGYDGDLELAMIPESFRTDILKEEQDANKVLSVRSVGSCRAMRPASPIRKMAGPAAADRSHRRRIGAGQFSNPLMHRPSQR